MSDAACPLCHSPVNHTDLLIDLDGRRASRLGQMIALPPLSAVVLEGLNRRHPSATSFDSLIMKMYGERDEPEFAHVVLKVRISALRRLLKPLGIEIQNAYGFGYKLVFHSEGIV